MTDQSTEFGRIQGKNVDPRVRAAAGYGTQRGADLEHLWVVYPGRHRFPLAERIAALPLHEFSPDPFHLDPFRNLLTSTVVQDQDILFSSS